MLSQLNQFFSLESRGKTALLGLGMQSAYSIWNTFSRLFAYLTEFLIIAGFVGLIARRDFHLESEFFALVLSAMVFLFLVILVPGLAETFSMSRLYHVLLFFLAPLFVLGAEFLAKFVFKRKTELYISILLLIVLVPYFLFQTGFVYELTDTQSWSVPLSKHRMDAVFLYRYIGYSYESDVFGALWMPKNVDVKSSWTHADVPSIYNVLTSYGMIYRGNTRELSNATLLSTGDNVYLSRVNVVDGVVVGLYSIWNTSSVSRVYDFASKIYSNGDCEIYKNTADLVNEQT